ncbi:MAG: HDOD domain-containing protein [Candidatus Omnitrophica bacterium]|nr:HDOD domain-containing protein [Candidatus Omnitrophota bacterium]MCB9781697.1 HDOD domain-containing protein [Candidatus Omnitrophota bacterium]
MTDIDELRRKFEEVENLPSLPTVVQEILDVTNDPRSGARDIQAVVENDQTCSVKLLKLANSAYYGFSRQVSSIKEAIVIIGMEGVKNVAMSLGVAECFLELGKANQHFLNNLWVHSMATATAAGVLAKKAQGVSPSYAYCSGLVHDFGKLILAGEFGQEYFELFEKAKEEKKGLVQIERSVLGVSHPQVAGWVARSWELPDLVIESVELHHEAFNLEAPLQHVTLTGIADALTYEAKIGDGGNGHPRRIDAQDLARGNIDQKTKDQAVADMVKNQDRFSALLNAAG